jgi:hypothetical protein
MQPDETAPDDVIVPVRAGDLAALLGMVHPERDWVEVPADITELISRVHGQLGAGRQPAEAEPAADVPEGGRWLELELMGHRVRTGYVTEVTVAGAAMLHVDLPAKIFGGEPDAWEEYAPSSLYGLSPVRPESVRSAWESKVKAAEERARREAEWRRMQEQRALTAGSDDDEGDGMWSEDDNSRAVPF